VPNGAQGCRHPQEATLEIVWPIGSNVAAESCYGRVAEISTNRDPSCNISDYSWFSSKIVHVHGRQVLNFFTCCRSYSKLLRLASSAVGRRADILGGAVVKKGMWQALAVTACIDNYDGV